MADGSETEPDDSDDDHKPSASAGSETLASPSLNEQEDSQVDPSLADWFKVEDDYASIRKGGEDDSETEPESDNMDVQDIDGDVDDLDDDEWFNISSDKPKVSFRSLLHSVQADL